MPLHEGEFDAEVIRHRWVELGRENKLALEVEYLVQGETVRGLLWFSSEAAASWGRKKLRSLGFDMSDPASDPAMLDPQEGQLRPYLLAGKKCRVKLAPKSHNGETRFDADLICPDNVRVGKGTLAALKAGKFAAPAAKAEKPAGAAGAKADAYDPNNPDDIPFLWLLPLIVPSFAAAGLASAFAGVGLA